ncbi:hypothetical protein [Nocardia sp. CA-119907]|uniref:hypothetical protein n=1 Tax=Nocardia sp. CA-119907 TaxID=3239973 RepID=UPI003D96D5E9
MAFAEKSDELISVIMVLSGDESVPIAEQLCRCFDDAGQQRWFPPFAIRDPGECFGEKFPYLRFHLFGRNPIQERLGFVIEFDIETDLFVTSHADTSVWSSLPVLCQCLIAWFLDIANAGQLDRDCVGLVEFGVCVGDPAVVAHPAQRTVRSLVERVAIGRSNSEFLTSLFVEGGEKRPHGRRDLLRTTAASR